MIEKEKENNEEREKNIHPEGVLLEEKGQEGLLNDRS